MAKRGAQPVPNGMEILLEKAAVDRQIVAVEYDNGTYHVENRKLGGKKGKYDFYPVRDNGGSFLINKYLSWARLFDTSALSPEKRRSYGIVAVTKGLQIAFPAVFTASEVAANGMDAVRFAEHMKAIIENETTALEYEIRHSPSGDKVEMVVYHRGCLEDFFPLDQVINAYKDNRWNLEDFREAFTEYWHRPIQELAKEHLIERDVDEAGPAYEEYIGLFSFKAFYATNRIIRIAAGLMLGLPIEATIHEIEKEEEENNK